MPLPTKDEARVLLGQIGIVRVQAAARRLHAHQEAQRHLHRADGEVGQRCRHRHHRPDAADVAQRDQQCRLGLESAQRRHHLVFGRSCSDVGLGVFEELGEPLFRSAAQHPQQPLRLDLMLMPDVNRLPP